MNTVTSRRIIGGLLVLAVGAALACGSKPEAPAAADKTAAAPRTGGTEVALTAAAFELNLRILEGSRDKPYVPNRPVTSSYLEFLTFSNFETAEDRATDEQIAKVFSIKDLNLLTEAALVWEKGQSEKAFHVFRINGGEYLVMVTPGRLPERNQFRIEVFEQSGGKKASLLDTEFALPDRTAAVFGFEDTKSKSYFITLRVSRWLGEPDAAAGGPGGVEGDEVPGLPKAGHKVKPPKLVREVSPVYPELARQAGIEGIVILEATTDTYGRVASTKVLRGVGALNQAAIDAVKQWVYEPMVIDGKPQPVAFTVTVRFRLDDKKKPQVEGVVGGVIGGVTGGVEGAVEGGVEGGVVGGVEGGVVGGVLGGVEGGLEADKQFEGGAVRAVGKVKPPKIIKQVEPVYPEAARKAGVEGLVIIEAKADEQGRVSAVRVLRSIPLLDQAAIDAVKQWTYEPMVIDGKPHPVAFTVTVRVTLKDGPQPKIPEKFAEGAVKAEGDIKPPKLVKEVAPAYPELARQARVQGVVILSVRTDETGRVVDAAVLRSIPLLDQAAIDAVRQWVYEPFVKDGKPVPLVFTATVRFVLE